MATALTMKCRHPTDALRYIKSKPGSEYGTWRMYLCVECGETIAKRTWRTNTSESE